MSSQKEGKTDLVEFLVNRTPRAVGDILNTTWEIKNAAEKLAQSKKTRLEAKEKECTEGCDGLWMVLCLYTFCNPASGSFAWVGVQNAECIFLNNFRWSPQVIP